MNAHSPSLQFFVLAFLLLAVPNSHSLKKSTYTTIQFCIHVESVLKKLASVTSHDPGILYNLIASMMEPFLGIRTFLVV